MKIYPQKKKKSIISPSSTLQHFWKKTIVNPHFWKKAIVNPSGPRTLSPSASLRASRISSFSNSPQEKASQTHLSKQTLTHLQIQKNNGKIGLTSLQYTNQLDIQGTFKKYLTSVNLVKTKSLRLASTRSNLFVLGFQNTSSWQILIWNY